MVLEEILDAICDIWEYIISFSWLSDIWEIICSIFENIGEFSIMGVIFGLIGFGTIFLTRDYMLKPFLIHMGTTESIIWAGATYVGSFIAGYLLGKHFENT